MADERRRGYQFGPYQFSLNKYALRVGHKYRGRKAKFAAVVVYTENGHSKTPCPEDVIPQPTLLLSGNEILTPEGTAKLSLAGFNLEGLSIGGQETCITIPSLRIAFDIGRCPQRAVFQDTLMISHAHLDHLGGIGFYVATRRMFNLKKGLVLMPPSCVENTQKLLTVLATLEERMGEGGETGEEGVSILGIAGYLVFSRKQKLKSEFVGLPSEEIKKLKASGIEVTSSLEAPEVAFTGDTTGAFITHPENADVLRAKLLIMELTFVDDSVSVEDAHRYGHTHISEIVEHADKFQNEAILFIHFSARYKKNDILENLNKRLPESLRKRACALTVRFG